MQSNLTPNLLGDLQKQFDLNIALTEIRGKKFELGAPVTCSTSIKNSVAVGCGDGTIRFLSSKSDPIVSKTHDGVVLCMTKADDAVLTGGDDGRLKRTSVNGEVEEIASFGTKWVDSVAESNGTFACSFIFPKAFTESSSGTETLTKSAPTFSSSLICSKVFFVSVVKVLVIL